MNVAVSAGRSAVRDLIRLDRAQISYVAALRNAIGVVVPLLAGAESGHLLIGLTVSLGALQVAFSDRPGPYRLRAGRMLLAGLCSALSVLVGATTGAVDWLAVPLAALWAFGGGLVVALGQTATQIGLNSVVLLLVFAARPATVAQAAAQAGLVLAGAIFQTLLAVAAWPVRPFGPQRAALAAAFRGIAAVITSPTDPRDAPPATNEINTARTTLSGLGSSSSATGELLRAMVDEAERIRLEVLALDDARNDIRRPEHNAALVDCVDEALAATANVLVSLAESLTSGRPPAATAGPLQRVDDAAREARRAIGDRSPVWVAVVATHLEALGGQLRAAVDFATRDSSEGEEMATRTEAQRPPALRLREPLATLRANLTLRSAACRHAVRLALCLAVADALTRAVALPRAYWVPMTVAIVLKPNFGATVSRGFGRMVGTALGLGFATILVYAVFGEVAGRIALLGGLMFVIRSVGAANYGLLVIALTALVVVLTSFAGARPEATIVERGIDTLAGGALALLAYALWPTWERTQTPAILADLLEAYREYFAAVMTGYLEPGRYDPVRLETTRLAARLARTNAEASVDRLRDEPARSPYELDRAVGLLANSHRFAHSAVALEAGLYHEPPEPAPAALHHFVADVDTTLHVLAQALRNPGYHLGELPNLRADQRALVEPIQGDVDSATGYPRAVIVTESDRATDSINTMTAVLRRANPAARARAP